VRPPPAREPAERREAARSPAERREATRVPGAVRPPPALEPVERRPPGLWRLRDETMRVGWALLCLGGDLEKLRLGWMRCGGVLSAKTAHLCS